MKLTKERISNLARPVDLTGEALQDVETSENEAMNEYLDRHIGGNADSEWDWNDEGSMLSTLRQSLVVKGKDGRYVKFLAVQYPEGPKTIHEIFAEVVE